MPDNPSGIHGTGQSLTEGDYLKTLVTFSVPILLANIIQLLYSTVDVIVLGQFNGSVGTVSITSGGEMAALVTSLGTAFASAGQIYISQLAGARDRERLGRAVGSFWTFMLLSALVIMAANLMLSRLFLTAMNVPADAFEEAYCYMMITNLGFPFIYLYNSTSGTLRAMGDSKAPLVFITVSSLINLVLDVLFVGIMGMGPMGAAIATVTGQGVSCTSSLIYTYRRRTYFGIGFGLKSWKMERESTGILLGLGIPLAAQSVLLNGAQMYCNSLVNSFGLTASAVNGIGNKINRIANVLRNSICSGASSMIGQYIGSGRPDRVEKVVYASLAFAFAAAFADCAAALVIPEGIIGIFNKDPKVVALGTIYLRIAVLSFLMSAAMGPYNAVLLASGATGLALLIGVLDGVVCRIGISLLLVYKFNMGITGFFWGNCLCMIVPLMIEIIYFYSGRWKKRKLVG